MSNLMPKAGKSKSERRKISRAENGPEQIALGNTAAREGYVRLRMRYDHGNLSVVGVKRVSGPLVSKERLEEGFVYEVTRGRRRIYTEALPDLGVERSFPPPEGEETAEVHGHHIVELDIYEFNVRVPANEFTTRSLRNLQVTLYETTEIPESLQMDARTLKTQFDKELREVSKLKGIDRNKLPNNVQQQLDESLR